MQGEYPHAITTQRERNKKRKKARDHCTEEEEISEGFTEPGN